MARLIGGGAGSFSADDLIELLAKSSRFVRCSRCGALTRIGDTVETWIPGPSEPPPSTPRRAVVIEQRRAAFEELWTGARGYVVVPADVEVLVGDAVRVVETYPAEQRDPFDAPRFVLGIATSRAEFRAGVIVSMRVIERGVEDRTIEARRTRLIAALEESGAHVATAATLLGISVGEAYKWVHELGLEERIKRYRPRTRRRSNG